MRPTGQRRDGDGRGIGGGRQLWREEVGPWGGHGGAMLCGDGDGAERGERVGSAVGADG